MTVIFHVDEDRGEFAALSELRLQCPSCLHFVTLAPLGDSDRQIKTRENVEILAAALRICPRPECHALIFVVHGGGQCKIHYSTPPTTVEIDSADIPDRVLVCLTEAVKCHAAECYIAAGIMIRKTLEELCEDKGATGANLQARLSALGTAIILPTELVEALDDLRLLGNDAAHVQAKTYNDIGKPEVDISLRLTKEILKATYQYASLLADLRTLKKNP